MSKENSDNSQYENCVMCGETTKVLVQTPINCRENYIHGCGQLCEKCANIIEREETNRIYKNAVPNIDMEILLANLRKKDKGD